MLMRHFGQQLGVVRFESDRTGVPAGLVRHPPGEDVGDLLVRAVLEQPREEQVAGLQQREVRLVLDLGGGQQPRRLQIEQRGGDDQELGGLVEVPVRPHGADVGHELVGDPGQRDLGDVQLVLGDQLEEEVEGALEVVEDDLEPAVVGLLLRVLLRFLGRCSAGLAVGLFAGSAPGSRRRSALPASVSAARRSPSGGLRPRGSAPALRARAHVRRRPGARGLRPRPFRSVGPAPQHPPAASPAAATASRGGLRAGRRQRLRTLRARLLLRGGAAPLRTAPVPRLGSGSRGRFRQRLAARSVRRVLGRRGRARIVAAATPGADEAPGPRPRVRRAARGAESAWSSGVGIAGQRTGEGAG